MALSSHGTFAAYRYKISKVASPVCEYGAETQDAQHIFKACPLYEEYTLTQWDMDKENVIYCIMTHKDLEDTVQKKKK